MKKKMLIGLAVLSLAAGCGKVSTLKNGEDALVSFTNSDLGISANDLYSLIKDSSTSKLVDLIDKKILQDKYPDKEEDAKKYAEEQFSSIKEYYVDDDGNFDEDTLRTALYQYYGISDFNSFKEMLVLSYYRDLAIDDYAKSLITDKEISKYYDENVYPDIKCSHILIGVETKDDATDEEKEKADADALKKAKEVIKKLKAGEDFTALAKEYSTDTATSEKGGDLDYFNEGEMVTEFWDAAKVLKVDEYTKTPVKTTYGYHIILKTAEKEKKSLEDSKEEIIETLAKEKKTNDSTLQIDALVELRKEYGMNIEDDEMNTSYSTYISNQLLNAQSSSSNK